MIVVRDVLVVFTAITVLGGVLAFMSYSLRWARRYEGRGRAALGNAFQELDRQIARPSVENKLEHEAAIVYEDDERGGE